MEAGEARKFTPDNVNISEIRQNALSMNWDADMTPILMNRSQPRTILQS